jgi:hypothetical protein
MEFPKRSLALAPEDLEKNPLQFPTRSLAPPAAARVFPVSPRTPAKKKREKTSLLLPSTLAAQLLQKKKTRMHWSDVVKKHAVLIHNISIRVDRLHARIKEVPRHDLDLETSCVDNITTQRNYVITSCCCRAAQTFIWSSAKIKMKWMPQQTQQLSPDNTRKKKYMVEVDGSR